jgi:hypothetical protein
MRRPMVRKSLFPNEREIKAFLDGTKTTYTTPVMPHGIPTDYSQGNGLWIYMDECGTFIKDLSVAPFWQRLDHYNYLYGPYRVGETYYCREQYALDKHGKVVYMATHKGKKKYSWNFGVGAMGADKARIFLKVKEVRLRRLHDMTVEDSLKDGVKPNPKAKNPLSTYMRIWDEEQKIKWRENPWVWVLTVERVKKVEG